MTPPKQETIIQQMGEGKIVFALVTVLFAICSGFIHILYNDIKEQGRSTEAVARGLSERNTKSENAVKQLQGSIDKNDTNMQRQVDRLRKELDAVNEKLCQ